MAEHLGFGPPDDLERQPPSTNGHHPRPGRDDDPPARIPVPKLLAFCALTPATAVALFGLIVSLQQAIAGDDNPAWPHGWTSVVQCLAASIILGAGLCWIVWTERERLGRALRG